MSGFTSLADQNGVPVSTTNPLPVTGTSGGTPIPVTSGAYASAISHTRPADTTAYTANDVVGQTDTSTAAAFIFAAIAPAAGGDVIITSASLEVDLAAVPSGMTSFTLYLYSVTPPSALVDNAAWDLPAGDRASFLGAISLGSPVDLGSTLFIEQNSINKQVTAAGSSLFGYLVTAGAYTPASGTVYKVTLHGVGI